jgi:hypothetical protein
MARETDQIAQDHSAMLGSVSVINSVIATHAKGSDATDADFGHDMTHDEKKERVARSNGYLVHMKALEDWGSESFTAIDAAISAANTFADS